LFVFSDTKKLSDRICAVLVKEKTFPEPLNKKLTEAVTEMAKDIHDKQEIKAPFVETLLRQFDVSLSSLMMDPEFVEESYTTHSSTGELLTRYKLHSTKSYSNQRLIAEATASFLQRVTASQDSNTLEDFVDHMEENDADQIATDTLVDNISSEEHMTSPPKIENASEETSLSEEERYFSCRKCGIKLCEAKNIEPHQPGKGQGAFAHTKREQGRKKVECTSLFLGDQVMEWMGDMKEVEGKLSCPKCKGRVGSWNWSGAQCSCGYWCVPAIQILKSRVDLKKR